ncbi:monocarboxylate transporter 9-like [Ylistrum balloti]|uniref:monocarboxylate transporter 9-like n=1 Tax=Ylistrum balloti TaxID=509963 RepID=UPI002905CA3E|nr:monocarboxylate transporter 9-like [Ylistrum balloti]
MSISGNSSTNKDTVGYLDRVSSEASLDDKGRSALSPPDGGWGWVIVSSSLITRVILSGLQSSSGFFYLKFEEKYHQSAALTLWMCTLPGVLRTVLGVGMCLVFSPSVIIVNQYFSKRRGLANGIAGSTFGAFLFPAAIEFLFEFYGFFGAFLIQSGLVLNIVVCGSLFRPLLIEQNCKRKSRQTTNPEPSLKREQGYVECCNKSHFVNRCCSHSNIKNILVDYRFLSYIIAVALFYVSNQSVYAFIPLLAREVGIEGHNSVYVVTATVFFAGIGRIFYGAVNDMRFFRRYKIIVYNVLMVSTGITYLILPAATSTFTTMCVLYSIYGFMTGCIISQKSVIMVDIVGVENLVNALGILLLFQGVGSCVGPIISGYITDTSDTTSGVIYFGGICTTAGAIIFSTANVVHWIKMRRRAKSGNDMSITSRNLIV